MGAACASGLSTAMSKPSSCPKQPHACCLSRHVPEMDALPAVTSSGCIPAAVWGAGLGLGGALLAQLTLEDVQQILDDTAEAREHQVRRWLGPPQQQLIRGRLELATRKVPRVLGLGTHLAVVTGGWAGPPCNSCNPW